MSGLVVTGGSGRIGAMLRAGWGVQAAQWPGRAAWDVAAGPVDLPAGCTVLHLAAVLRSDLALNTEMAAHVGAAARAAGARRVIFASTAAVYGGGDADLHEDTAPCPVSGYGAAKLAAEHALRAHAGRVPVTVLRIGNVVGADALIGGAGAAAVTLDPVPGRAGGPLRSWIGPRELAHVLARLVVMEDLPLVLNIALPPAWPMADLLDATGKSWAYGAPNPAVIPRAVLCTRRLDALIPLPQATPATLIADWRAYAGVRV